MGRIAPIAALLLLALLPNPASASRCSKHPPFIEAAQTADLVATVLPVHVAGDVEPGIPVMVERVLRGSRKVGEVVRITREYIPYDPGQRLLIALIEAEGVFKKPHCNEAILRVVRGAVEGRLDRCENRHLVRLPGSRLLSTNAPARMTVDELAERIATGPELRCPATWEKDFDERHRDRSPRAISGIVVDEAGAPRAGVEMSAESRDRTWSTVVTSDGEGRFTLENAPASDVRMAAPRHGLTHLIEWQADEVRLVLTAD